MFGMGTGVAPPVLDTGIFLSWGLAPKNKKIHCKLNKVITAQNKNMPKSESEQDSRTISTGQLNALLHLHPQPIKLVFYKCPYDHKDRETLSCGGLDA